MIEEMIKETLAPNGYWAPFFLWLLFTSIFITLLSTILLFTFQIPLNIVGSSILIAFTVSLMMVFFQRIVIEGFHWKKNKEERELKELMIEVINEVLDEREKKKWKMEKQNQKIG